MVQVDVFWSYGLGSSFALAAGKQLAAERAAKKGLLDSPYFSKTLLFLSTLFAPSGAWLLWSFPSGLYVIGSRAGDRRNGMTANWVTQVSFEPKLVGVGIEKPALTHELISEGRSFTVCTIAREDRTPIA